MTCKPWEKASVVMSLFLRARYFVHNRIIIEPLESWRTIDTRRNGKTCINAGIWTVGNGKRSAKRKYARF